VEIGIVCERGGGCRPEEVEVDADVEDLESGVGPTGNPDALVGEVDNRAVELVDAVEYVPGVEPVGVVDEDEEVEVPLFGG
jgi:hypothetical protein